MDKIRTAVIGCGKVGATHALAYKTLPNSELCAVCDVSQKNANQFAKDYNVRAYSDIKKMIRENGVQVVSVCTPHPLHAEPTCEAAEAGANVICEKPLASDLRDCDRAITACEKAGVKLGVISQRRFYWPVIRMIQAIRDGKIGKPIIGTIEVMGWRSPEYYRMDGWRGKWREEGGGVMVNQTPHQIDLLQWMMGDIDELFGYWDNFNHPEIEVEDTALAIIRFKNGGIGQILVSNSQKPGLWGRIHIHGSNGASVGAQVEGGSSFISGVTTSKVEPAFNDIWTVPGEENMPEVWKKEDQIKSEGIDPMTYFHQIQIADFLDAVIRNRPPSVDGHEGRKTVEIFTAVYRSQRDHRPIKFPLSAEDGSDFDGRLSYVPYSHR